jgi:hypothetical protein
MTQPRTRRWILLPLAAAFLASCGAGATLAPAPSTGVPASGASTPAATVAPTAAPTATPTAPPTAPPTAAPASTPAPTAVPNPTAVPTAEDTLGQAFFGKITSFDAAREEMTVELAEMLTGDAANAAAVAAGVIKAGETVDDDYFIRPLGTTDVYNLNGDTEIKIIVLDKTGNLATVPATLSKFTKLLAAGPASTDWVNSGWFHFTVLRGHATTITAQYLP